jgi:hypothetical protein
MVRHRRCRLDVSRIRAGLFAALLALASTVACGDEGGAAPEPLLAEGEPCAAASECASARCVDRGQGGRCVRPCTEPKECAAEQRCLPRKGRVLDAAGVAAAEALSLLCVASPAGAGDRHLGEVCAKDEHCASGLCGPDSVCTRPCAAAGCQALSPAASAR